MWFYCIIYILRKSFKILYQWSDPSCVFPAETELGNRSWTKGAHQPHEPSPPGDVEANRKSSLLLLFPSRSNGQHCSCGTLPGHISFSFFPLHLWKETTVGTNTATPFYLQPKCWILAFGGIMLFHWISSLMTTCFRHRKAGWRPSLM